MWQCCQQWMCRTHLLLTIGRGLRSVPAACCCPGNSCEEISTWSTIALKGTKDLRGHWKDLYHQYSVTCYSRLVSCWEACELKPSNTIYGCVHVTCVWFSRHALSCHNVWHILPCEDFYILFWGIAVMMLATGQTSLSEEASGLRGHYRNLFHYSVTSIRTMWAVETPLNGNSRMVFGCVRVFVPVVLTACLNIISGIRYHAKVPIHFTLPKKKNMCWCVTLCALALCAYVLCW